MVWKSVWKSFTHQYKAVLVFINDLHNVSSVLSYIYFLQTILNLLLSGFLKIWMINWKKNTWWFISNSLSLNVNSQFHRLAAKNKKKVVGEEPKIIIENRDIERVYKTKILWVGVITLIILLIEFQKNIGIIVKVKNILNLKTTKNLYYSFIYPYLNYCCCVWGLACITYSSKLHMAGVLNKCWLLYRFVPIL